MFKGNGSVGQSKDDNHRRQHFTFPALNCSRWRNTTAVEKRSKRRARARWQIMGFLVSVRRPDQHNNLSSPLKRAADTRVNTTPDTIGLFQSHKHRHK
jgi:hypothetical protein